MQAIILAGGKGTRLAERLGGRPKPLVEVGGVPLLERQVRTLETCGVDDILVLVNHAADQIRSFFEQNSFAAAVRIVDDGEPRGTAGAVLGSLQLMDERAFIVYGDTLFDIDVEHMVAVHEAADADATLLLHPNDHPLDSHLVALDAGGFVTGFHSPPHPRSMPRRNLVNAAFYIVQRDALMPWSDLAVPIDFGNDLFPKMIAAGQRLKGYVSSEYIKDLGTPHRLDVVERHLALGIIQRSSRRSKQRAVFMDRDGTLNKPAGYVSCPDDIELIPNTAEAVRRLNDDGLRTILVTNQPVVARGECDLPTLERIHGRLEALLSEAGGYLDRIYFCPHHPHGGYEGEIPSLKIACDCRKPAIGMFEAAITEMNIDRHHSWMVGDSDADMLAANRAGILSLRVRTGEQLLNVPDRGVADVEVADFPAAVDFILTRYPKLVDAAARVAGDMHDDEILILDDDVPGFSAVLRNELLASGKTTIVIERPDHADDLVAPDNGILIVVSPKFDDGLGSPARHISPAKFIES